jgi:hypothetical protein
MAISAEIIANDVSMGEVAPIKAYPYPYAKLVT